MRWSGSLDLPTLRAAYAARAVSPEEVVGTIHDRIAAAGRTHAWIHLVPPRRRGRPRAPRRTGRCTEFRSA
jgi:hypothetical protein